MKGIYLLLLLTFPFLTQSQINMSVSGNYTQDFNSLASTGSNITWTDDMTIPSWYCQKSTAGAVVYDAGSGTLNTGKVYSFGSTASTDRALGTVGSGGVGNLAYGTLLRNTSLKTIEDISVSFTMEQWRDAGNATPAAQDLRVFYQISNSPITDLTPGLNTTWIEVPALLTLSPVNNTAATALDGNLPANQVVISNVSIPNLSVFAGQYIMIKWEDPNHTGSDQGLSIDDLTINWTVGCNTSNFMTEISCGDYTVPSGDEVHSVSGVYYDTIPNTGACDSVLIIDLTVNTPTLYFIDFDLDGYGDSNDPGTILCSNPGAGFSTNDTDCNDSDNTIYLGAPELCDGKDNDCNGNTDDGLTFINYYVDNDGDGFGTGNPVSLCSDPGIGFASQDGDCDDNDEFEFPGQVWYADCDGDGFYSDVEIVSCEIPTTNCNSGQGPVGGFSHTQGDDCDDEDASSYPNAPELCDNIDNNCDGNIDEGLTFTTYYVDSDLDGYGDNSDQGTDYCSDPGSGYSLNNTDCNDASDQIYPGATEILDNGVDENCDGTDNYLGINDFNLTIGIHPNPSNGTFVILNDSGKSLTYSILSLNASEITTGELSIGKNEMDLTSIEKGTYFIQVSFEGQKRTQKIVIN